MRAIYKELVGKSLGASLSAIEIYNKPDFQYRNETFVILIINAWELLLKAKILKDSNHKQAALFIKKNGRYKKTRNGNYRTIEIKHALECLEIDETVKDNIDQILEIRDTSIHFYNKDSISYAIFTLGVATLQNYQRLLKDWFETDLSDYNFYILPLGFKYSFKNFKVMNLSKEPEAIQNLIDHIVTKQNNNETEKNGYYFVADIQANIISAKKLVENPDATIAVDKNAGVKGLVRTQKQTDLYPLTALELSDLIKSNIPEIGQSNIWKFIANNGMKSKEEYSGYVFPSQKYEREFLAGKRKAPPASIYNHDALEFIIANIEDVKINDTIRTNTREQPYPPAGRHGSCLRANYQHPNFTI